MSSRWLNVCVCGGSAVVGQSTYLRAQAAPPGAVGGDLALEAGTGTTMGTIKLGLGGSAIQVGMVGKTVGFLGDLTANAAAVAGLVTTGMLSNAGAMTSSGGVTTVGLTASSGVLFQGTVSRASAAWGVGSHDPRGGHGRTMILIGPPM